MENDRISRAILSSIQETMHDRGPCSSKQELCKAHLPCCRHTDSLSIPSMSANPPCMLCTIVLEELPEQQALISQHFSLLLIHPSQSCAASRS